MDRDERRGAELLDRLGTRFSLLVSDLVEGNRKRAAAIAARVREQGDGTGPVILSQNLIERMAQEQAVKNALINLPSVVPGLGTVVSLSLVALENFYILDQSVTLILALCLLHGRDIDDRQALEEFTLKIIGEVFGVTGGGTPDDSRAITRGYVTRMLSRKFLNKGVDRSVRRVLRRLLPLRRQSRLLPAGIGLVSSALTAYETLVHAGRATLEHLPRFGSGLGEAGGAPDTAA